MIILNTTFFVPEHLAEELICWVKETYFLSAINEGALTDPSMARLLDVPEEGMAGFAVQLLARDIDFAKEWHDGRGGVLRSYLAERYPQEVLFFTTYMEKLV
ncbi:MAG: DUF4286 family protein [Duncaniella sp.]|nr:DUF4286 family protein [Duncaniella sp.]